MIAFIVIICYSVKTSKTLIKLVLLPLVFLFDFDKENPFGNQL